MKRIIIISGIILLCVIVTKRGVSQEMVEFLGLRDKNVASLSLYTGVIVVGTDRNGVYWQFENSPTDTGWINIGLDSMSVQTVYAHGTGPSGWAVSAGVDPDVSDSVFIYCSFMGGEFFPNSLGISKSLTDRINEIDGFTDPKICGETYAAGGGALYRQKSGDSLWVPVYTASAEGYVLTVKIHDQYPVILAGGAEGYTGILLIRSYDHGETWEYLSALDYVHNFDFAGDSAQVIFTTSVRKVYRSTDSGNLWELVFDGEGWYSITEVLFDSSTSMVYIAGGDGLDTSSAILFYSNDLGDSWQQLPLEMSGPIVDMDIGSDGWIYFATPYNGVFRFNQKVVNLKQTAEAFIPATIELFQNYPNPFNAYTTIRYDIPGAGKVVLTVYNILGQEIEKLVNEYQPPGEYAVKWDASNVKSGIYFYVLKAFGNTWMHKMIVLR